MPAFAYRFDAADRSIVISGDTAPSDELIALARGADVLVHEAMFPAGVDRLVATVPNAATLKQSILSHHTSAEDAGRVAQAAGVKTLVLSHFVPADDPGDHRADVARRRQDALPRHGHRRQGPPGDPRMKLPAPSARGSPARTAVRPAKRRCRPTPALYFYECTACRTVFRPKPGDCCVFCSFGTAPCPPVQLSGTCCADGRTDGE